MNNSIAMWMDGKKAQGLPPQDRGLHYGDGVFRTLLLWNGQVQQLSRQLNKLRSDAGRIGLVPPSFETLQEDLRLAVSPQQSGVIKFVLTAGDSQRGYSRDDRPCRRLIFLNPLPAWPRSHWSAGIQIESLAYRLSSQPALAGIKHLNRLDQVLARGQLSGDCQEGLVADQDGYLLSGVMSNVFWQHDGQWHTPALDAAGVAGCMREQLIELMSKRDCLVKMTRAKMQDVQQQCDAVFVCNSLLGLWPVAQWGTRQFVRSESVDALMSHLAHPFSGQDA